MKFLVNGEFAAGAATMGAASAFAPAKAH